METTYHFLELFGLVYMLYKVEDGFKSICYYCDFRLKCPKNKGNFTKILSKYMICILKCFSYCVSHILFEWVFKLVESHVKWFLMLIMCPKKWAMIEKMWRRKFYDFNLKIWNFSFIMHGEDKEMKKIRIEKILKEDEYKFLGFFTKKIK